MIVVLGSKGRTSGRGTHGQGQQLPTSPQAPSDRAATKSQMLKGPVKNIIILSLVFLFLIVDHVTLKMSVLAGLNSSSAMSGPASESVMAMEWGGIAGIELRSSRLRSSSRPAPRGTPPGPRAVSLLRTNRFSHKKLRLVDGLHMNS